MNYDILNNSKQWISRNARPLDFARFQYHFGNGSKEAVLAVLEAYQNEDGGFGHALEADSFNPNSAPIQTWVATEILWEIKMLDGESPIIKGILKFLESGKEFNGESWLKTIPSNNDYPGAYWWTFQENDDTMINYNPSIQLAAFALMYLESSNPFYETCVRIVTSGVDALLSTNSCDEMHTLSCFVRMTEFFRYAKLTTLIDLDYVEQILREKILSVLTQDTSTWKTNYVCKPSQFIRSKESAFYETLKEIAVYECKFMEENQGADGTWSANWDWNGYKEEWQIAKNWWKSDIIIKNLLFLKGINE